MTTSHLPLFGGSRAWSQDDWTSSDDRVRGGSSISHLSASSSSLEAKFHGTLDIKTLGGAGFASQRTTGDNRNWDLSLYDGIELVLGPSDGKTYTLTLKDQILPKRPDGRDRSSVSWEFDFKSKSGGNLFIPWGAFRATYRGREVEGGKLDLKSIKRVGIMVRSFFGEQEGDFELGIYSISALRGARRVEEEEEEEFDGKDECQWARGEKRERGWFSWLGSCIGCRS
ncbi:hypothetical protein N7456_000559 [Penicillium angulare]|uniref:NADH:ubiquinone oxidoreductase intermediate-associated protein 30 domain-containing protein n=1 Tax=Penicillium angulare TaxID=116970 RepID=A0A9W9GCR1_9EURO|nr:hypothetical protein N7456_000559 [Penicillium angulare]